MSPLKLNARIAITNLNGDDMLKLDWATHDAAKYACERWHYSRSVPPSKSVKIGVWEHGKFIGVIIYGLGATPMLCRPYGLQIEQMAELVRIALDTHETPVSRMMAISLKFLKRHCPGIKLVASFADTGQGHHGGVYQASNWVYAGMTRTDRVVNNGTKSTNCNRKFRFWNCRKTWLKYHY